ncbi:hypothetical protein AOLI_G00283360 [Acnodon oligacanthus]
MQRNRWTTDLNCRRKLFSLQAPGSMSTQRCTCDAHLLRWVVIGIFLVAIIGMFGEVTLAVIGSLGAVAEAPGVLPFMERVTSSFGTVIELLIVLLEVKDWYVLGRVGQ